METVEINRPYSKFALPYSLTQETSFSERMAELVVTLVSSRENNIKYIIDLACGVGAACHYFAQKGYHATGVDVSESMLMEAKKKMEDLGLNIKWYQQDMRNLCVPVKADLVTCMYDSINFMLNDPDLLEVFSRVFSCLTKEGCFVFDVYTLLGLSICWGNKEEIHTIHASHFIASQTTWNENTHIGTKSLYGFSKKGEYWQSWQEKHVMRAYDLAHIENLLYQVGFKSFKAYDADDLSQLSELKLTTKRAIIIASIY